MDNILSKLAFTGVLFLLISSSVEAQVNKKELSKKEIKKINEQLKLVASKEYTKTEMLFMDSVLMHLELNEEENEFPADELYEGAWNNDFLKVYANVNIPDSFKIDISSFVMPVTGMVTSPYGPRWRRFHYGTDIKLQTGDTVYAAFNGKVRVCSYERKGYGNYLVIRHPNGMETVYGHLSESLVSINENVQAGQPIALGGNTGRSTGSHLHFEFRFLGQAIDPSDIIDFTHFCTYDDSYVFNKSRSGDAYFNVDFYTKFKSLKSNFASKTKAKYYKVRSGDTLLAIAQRYGTSVDKICRLNGIKATTTLKIGRSLRCS
ncbi:MAG: peptidoglycan DD-metalloendopeptidase family protein [Dysgonamonadaceae bacterium]|jgi:murein DD-endopeptidase MepM/ murein hydrolase activator NlpD|nr:peptidoglycan DD-metalloendopeptidase family protein [Dysgonamonadaceae bacterium]